MKRYVSISLRLTLWFGAIFFCGYLIFGTAMWLFLKGTLTAERHQTLSRRADRLEELLSRNPGAATAERSLVFKDFAHATGNGLAEVFTQQGKRLYPSPSAAAAAFPWPALADDRSESFLHVRSGDQLYWVLARPFQLDKQTVHLVMAAPEAGNLLVLNGFWRGLLASVPILLLVSSAAGYWVSRRALRPVDRITATARSISIRNLSERLPVNDSGDELQRLAETCNEMLGRLESAVARIKRFTADASHELRGPLSLTRTVAEVALRNPLVDSKSRIAFQDIVEETAKATVLLEQMLMLARADSESTGATLEPIDLEALVKETCSMAQRLGDERKMTISLSCPPRPLPTILGDSASLRRLLWIMLDNSLKYSHSPGRVDVLLSGDSSEAVLSVIDTGVGIAESDLPHIFDRFYRADPSRSNVEGNGLGLAIAKWIAENHHAEISVASRENEGTMFKVVFPFLHGGSAL